MNASELLAYDVRRHKVVARIPVPGVHGVACGSGDRPGVRDRH